MKFLLDTCVISELTRKLPTRHVVEWIGSQDELQLFLSVITLGEIERGIDKLSQGRKKETLRQWLAGDLPRRFAGRVLPIDAETALRWGEISAEAEGKGRPVPVLDGLMAATALVHGLTLVTRNTADVAGTPVGCHGSLGGMIVSLCWVQPCRWDAPSNRKLLQPVTHWQASCQWHPAPLSFQPSV